MKWVDRWIGFASDNALKKECERRKIHQLVTHIPPAKIEREIGYQEIYDALPKTYINPNNNVEYYVRSSLWDQTYHLTSIDEIRRFVDWNLIDKEEYQSDDFDCDDFAICTWGDLRLWSPGLLAGLILIPGHAKNWFMSKDKVLYSIEPQSDVITLIEPTVSHYFA